MERSIRKARCSCTLPETHASTAVTCWSARVCWTSVYTPRGERGCARAVRLGLRFGMHAPCTRWEARVGAHALWRACRMCTRRGERGCARAVRLCLGFGMHAPCTRWGARVGAHASWCMRGGARDMTRCVWFKLPSACVMHALGTHALGRAWERARWSARVWAHAWERTRQSARVGAHAWEQRVAAHAWGKTRWCARVGAHAWERTCGSARVRAHAHGYASGLRLRGSARVGAHAWKRTRGPHGSARRSASKCEKTMVSSCQVGSDCENHGFKLKVMETM